MWYHVDMNNQRRLTVVPDLDHYSTQSTDTSDPATQAFEEENGMMLLLKVYYANPRTVACLDVLAHRPWEETDNDDWRWAVPDADGCVRNAECDIAVTGLIDNPRGERARAFVQLLCHQELDTNSLYQEPELVAEYVVCGPHDEEGNLLGNPDVIQGGVVHSTDPLLLHLVLLCSPDEVARLVEQIWGPE